MKEGKTGGDGFGGGPGRQERFGPGGFSTHTPFLPSPAFRLRPDQGPSPVQARSVAGPAVEWLSARQGRRPPARRTASPISPFGSIPPACHPELHCYPLPSLADRRPPRRSALVRPRYHDLDPALRRERCRPSVHQSRPRLHVGGGAALCTRGFWRRRVGRLW